MKKIVLIIAIIMYASVQIRASHLASDFNLRLFDQALFTVNIDHQVFNTPTNRFQLKAIAPGQHFLRVTRLEHGYYGPHTVPVLVFSGYIYLPSGAQINAMIDRQNRFRINKIIPYMPEPVQYGMSDYEFDQLRNTIDRLSFDSSRMQVAKQAIAHNMVTTRQVYALMNMMTFESNKLELAKYAYAQTVDKQNYFVVNDAFTFESSILNLNDFIYRS
jgi:Domain of unknown function (DUF4476)